MSSCICSSKHFNSIERAITDLTQKGKMPYSFRKETDHMDKAARDLYITEVVDELRRLNVICFFHQYASHYPDIDKEIKESIEELMTHKKSTEVLDRVGLFKALNGLTYQIETEHLLEVRPLTDTEWNALDIAEQLENYLCREIVQESPAYDKAKWSID